MPSDWMKKRQTKYAAYASVYILVILGVLTAMNVLANRYDKSFDSTKNKQFSLSDQTIKVVKNLKQDATLTYFGSEDSFKSGRDMLDQYSNLSPKIHTQYLAPDKNPTKAKAAGYRSDSPVIVDVGGRREGAKSLTEEEITGALIRATKTGERNVCFVNGFGEHSIDDQDRNGFSVLKALLDRDNYKSRSISFKPEAPAAGGTVAIGKQAAPANVTVPSDCTVLVSGGPQEDYPQPVVDAIKSYVDKGGRGMFMLDNVIRIGRQDAAAENAALASVLTGWGVTVNKDLVLDSSGIGQLFGFGPEIPVVMQYESHQITSPMGREMTAFELARSLDVKSGAGWTIDPLAKTTDDSIAVTQISPDGHVDTKAAKKGPFTLMAAGRMTGGPGRFIVVGTSQWATNPFVGSRQLGNRDLFVNSINWLSNDEDLISILPKSPEDQKFDITPAKQNTLFWLCVFIFPLGVVSFGLATWWKRR
ncbi:MAG TPA: GldG family protein [Verrucomicrobiae bacterium]|nr:GldG family protein [Verrucomicrobiae bacterium]